MSNTNLERTLRNFGRPFNSGSDVIIPLSDNTGKLVYSSMRNRWEHEERITSADRFAEYLEGYREPPTVYDLLAFYDEHRIDIDHINVVNINTPSDPIRTAKHNLVQSVKFGDGSIWSLPTKKCGNSCSEGKTNHWNEICLECGAAQNEH